MSIRPRGAVVSPGAVEAQHHADFYVTREELQQYANSLESRLKAANSAFEAFEKRHTQYATDAYNAIDNLYQSNVALMALLEAWTNQQYEFNFELTKQVCALRVSSGFQACPPDWVYRREMLVDQEMADASDGNASHDPSRKPPRSSTPYVLTTAEHQAEMERYKRAKQTAEEREESAKKTVRFLLDNNVKVPR